MNTEYIKRRLNEIAAEMRKPKANMAKLEKEMDKLLGFDLKTEDREALETWEQNRDR